MKKTILSLVLATAALSANAQTVTATNFNANDCAGNNHDLFAELDAGKVIVLTWVMPCGSCVAPAQTASAVVQSYASSNPNTVLHYVIDDYGNTNCNTLNNWVSSNSIIGTTFSNSVIDMTDYGAAGMPKIVVVGGTGHFVFFNENNAASNNATGIENAIDQALLVGINDNNALISNVTLAPNPAASNSTLTVNMKEAGEMTIAVYNTLGQQVMSVYNGSLAAGETKFQLNLAELTAGTYFIQVSNATTRRVVRFSVVE